MLYERVLKSFTMVAPVPAVTVVSFDVLTLSPAKLLIAGAAQTGALLVPLPVKI